MAQAVMELQLLRRLWIRRLPVVVLLVAAAFSFSDALLDSTEKEALLTIKREWALKGNASTWVASTDPCVNSWAGIECDPLGNHVITVNVTTMRANGDMPEAFRNLTSLENLDAQVPTDTNTSITGDLAPLTSLAASLKSLNVSRNYRHFQFPDIVFTLTNLTELRLQNNYLQGSPNFSPKIVNLQKLESLYIASNNIISLPDELWTLQGLRELSLWNNSLFTEIPAAIGNLVNLELFHVHDCSLWGGIPSEIGSLTRMNALWLYANTLTGHIPDTMRSLTNLTDLQIDTNLLTGSYSANLSGSLTTMEAACNYLTGPELPLLPSTGNFTYPTTWDVDGNCFPSQIKDSRIDQCRAVGNNISCDQYLALVANGACPPCPANQQPYNITLCTCKLNGPRQDSTNSTAVMAGVIGAVAGVLIIIVIILCLLWKAKNDRAKLVGRFDIQLAEELCDPNWQAPPGLERYKFSELLNATGGFNEAHKIGEGGFGNVFVANFKDGRKSAIKRASGRVSSTQGLAGFRNEVLLLSRLHHRNLVRLEGFCDDAGEQILVYEFMRQGDLHDNLRPKGSRKHLSWFKRLEIAVGVAHGLEYLHSYADPPVIHRDVKPSNILLDDNLVAKVADFGISRVTDESATHVSTRPAGTLGYIDPQCFIRQQLTTASDVYGYGVVLLELVTGQRAIDHQRTAEVNLVEWVKPRFPEEGIEAIADPKLGDDYPRDVFRCMADLGMTCALTDKDQRPSMKEVIATLQPKLHNCVKPPHRMIIGPRGGPWNLIFQRMVAVAQALLRQAA